MTIKFIGSPNFDNSRKPIKQVVIHWIVGDLTSADATFQKVGGVSAHYGVEDEIIHQYVLEEDTAYAVGVYYRNQESISIEHSASPDRLASNATYSTSAKLIADICQRNNIPVDRQHIIGHNEIKATQCTGTMDIDRLIREANSEIIAQPIAQLTLQTIIPKELLEGEDQNLEIQQVAGLLKDGKRDNLDLQNCRKELKQCQDSHSTSPDAPKTVPIDKSDPPNQTFQLPPIVTQFLGWLRKKLGL